MPKAAPPRRATARARLLEEEYNGIEYGGLPVEPVVLTSRIAARSDDHPSRDDELHDYLTLGADDLLRRC